MGVGERNCDNCAGSVKSQCDEALNYETSLISSIQAYDAQEAALAQEDARLPDTEKNAIAEAAQIESVHFFDHRVQRLITYLGDFGCELKKDEVKEKLINRLAGI